MPGVVPGGSRNANDRNASYVTREDLTVFGTNLLSSFTKSIDDMTGTIIQNIGRTGNRNQGSGRDTTRHIKTRKSGFPVRRGAGINANHVIIDIQMISFFVCAHHPVP